METRQYTSFRPTEQSARVFLGMVGLGCYIRKRSSYANGSYYIPKQIIMIMVMIMMMIIIIIMELLKLNTYSACRNRNYIGIAL